MPSYMDMLQGTVNTIAPVVKREPHRMSAQILFATDFTMPESDEERRERLARRDIIDCMRQDRYGKSR